MVIWKNLELLKALMKETTQTNEFISSVGSEPDHFGAHQTFKDSRRWNYEKPC